VGFTLRPIAFDPRPTAELGAPRTPARSLPPAAQSQSHAVGTAYDPLQRDRTSNGGFRKAEQDPVGALLLQYESHARKVSTTQAGCTPAGSRCGSATPFIRSGTWHGGPASAPCGRASGPCGPTLARCGPAGGRCKSAKGLGWDTTGGCRPATWVVNDAELLGRTSWAQVTL
jgi:hypothetical protein